jgi:hypothetical protein
MLPRFLAYFFFSTPLWNTLSLCSTLHDRNQFYICTNNRKNHSLLHLIFIFLDIKWEDKSYWASYRKKFPELNLILTLPCMQLRFLVYFPNKYTFDTYKNIACIVAKRKHTSFFFFFSISVLRFAWDDYWQLAGFLRFSVFKIMSRIYLKEMFRLWLRNWCLRGLFDTLW